MQLLLFAVLLLFAPHLSVTKVLKRFPNSQADNLPDISDSAVLQRLEANACRSVAEYLHGEISRLYTLRHGTLRPFEVADLIDGACRRFTAAYGLLMRNNRATEEFSRDEAISRVRGDWINALMDSQCGRVVSQLEDDALLDQLLLHKNFITLPEFERRVCDSGE